MPVLPQLLLAAAAARDVLLITLENNHTILRMETDGSNPVSLLTGCGKDGPQCPVSFPDDQRVFNGKVYWTNMGTGVQSNCMLPTKTGSVWRADWPSMANVEVVVPTGTIGCAKQMYVDEKRQHLYVGDKGHYTPGAWRIDVSSGPPFAIEPLIHKDEHSASAVSLDHTGEYVITAADGEGQPGCKPGGSCQPPGFGVFNRVMPDGMTAQNRTDVVWYYTDDNIDHVITDSKGAIYWDNGCGFPPLPPGSNNCAIRSGSTDGKAPAKTLQTNATVGFGVVGAVGIELSRDEQTLYYADFGSGNPMTGHIYKSSIHGGDKPQLLYTADPGIQIDGVALVSMP